MYDIQSNSVSDESLNDWFDGYSWFSEEWLQQYTLTWWKKGEAWLERVIHVTGQHAGVVVVWVSSKVSIRSVYLVVVYLVVTCNLSND